MPQSLFLRNVSDRAQSEAKRSGLSEPNLAHLALVLQQVRGDEFAARFPDVTRARLDALVKGYKAPVGEIKLAVLLENAESTADSWASLCDAITPLLSQRVTAPAATTESRAQGEETGAGVSSSDPRPSSNFDSVAEVVTPDPTILGRESFVNRILSLLAQKHSDVPCITGLPGSGRTSILSALANHIQKADHAGSLRGCPVIRIRAEDVVSRERAHTLRRMLRKCDQRSVLAFDDVETMAALGGMGPDLDVLGVLRSSFDSIRFHPLLILNSTYLPKLEVLSRDLFEALTVLELPPLALPALRDIAQKHAHDLEKYHHVAVNEQVLDFALLPARPGERLQHPGLLINRLDLACAKASLHGQAALAVEDLGLDAEQARQDPLDMKQLQSRLARRIKGQEMAIARICARLRVTRARMDLRPQRPDGVFLFVGPTGVGKTALARALAAELFGDERALIRLDMSEYSHDWAVARLIGPQPGYVGFTEPESWLTTQVIGRPRCVLLLDEIEKAHPVVWNVFLQVFDEGRLTDSRGKIAPFSEAVVIMTSNLGSEMMKGTSLGFGQSVPASRESEMRVLSAVKERMRPELLNRLDQIVFFPPLSRETIRAIALQELERAADMLKHRGYHAEIPPEVVDEVARQGYLPEYGARHLERNIERLVLETISLHPAGAYVAALDNEDVIWRPRSS